MIEADYILESKTSQMTIFMCNIIRFWSWRQQFTSFFTILYISECNYDHSFGKCKKKNVLNFFPSFFFVCIFFPWNFANLKMRWHTVYVRSLALRHYRSIARLSAAEPTNKSLILFFTTTISLLQLKIKNYNTPPNSA